MTCIQSQQPRHRVLLVEGQPLVRYGLADLINAAPDLRVCGVAADPTSALQKLTELRPDLVLVGAISNERHALDLLKRIKAIDPSQHVLLFSTLDEAIYAHKALRAGASGFLMRDEPTATLLSAIRYALAGEIFISERLKRKMLGCSFRKGKIIDPLDTLSPRERQVLHLIGQGVAWDDIASRLGITLRTVESHRTHIKDKLNLQSITALVQNAFEAERDRAA